MKLKELATITDNNTRIIIGSYNSGKLIADYKTEYQIKSDFDNYTVKQIGVYDTNTIYAYID